MTKRQRAQVVELLRVAADINGIASAFELMTGIEVTGAHYQPGGRRNYPIWDMAVRAREAVADDGQWTEYRWSCLEAAQRVEDHQWP
jgi:hypothetical protein